MADVERIHLGTDGNIYSGSVGGDLIATLPHGIGDESVKGEWGRRIVLAVNLFDDLVAACEAALKYIPGSEVRSWPPGFELKQNALRLLCDVLLEAAPLVRKENCWTDWLATMVKLHGQVGRLPPPAGEAK